MTSTQRACLPACARAPSSPSGLSYGAPWVADDATFRRFYGGVQWTAVDVPSACSARRATHRCPDAPAHTLYGTRAQRNPT